jgi:hybrid cluster-associated redox disulfide protein
LTFGRYYGILYPLILNRKVKKMKVTKQTLIGDVLDHNVETARFFFEIGMHCLGCPHSRGESIEDACQVHGTNADELVAKINAFLGEA